MIEQRTVQCDLVIQSTKHELFFQGPCDKACPPDTPQHHAHGLPPRRLIASVVLVAKTTHGRTERDRRQLVSQIIKLGCITLVRIVQQEGSDSRSGNQRIVIVGCEPRTCLIKNYTFDMGKERPGPIRQVAPDYEA